MSNSIAATLEKELTWFHKVLDTRIDHCFEHDYPHSDITEIPPPNLVADESSYAHLIKTNGFGFDERILLILSLTPPHQTAMPGCSVDEKPKH